MGNAESIVATLAKQESELAQHDQNATQANAKGDIFDQLAAKDTQAAASASKGPDIFDQLAAQDTGNAERIVNQLAANNGQIPDETQVQGAEKPYNPAEHSAVSRFGHAFAAPFVSIFHGIADEPQDANEVGAHAGGGQGGVIAYRAAKQLMAAHDAMQKASPGKAFRQAAQDFQNAVTDYLQGNTRDALMHTVSGGLSTVGAVEPDVQGALERPRAISEGAASGGDLATPLGSTTADVAMGAATYGAGRGLSALRGAAQAGEAAEEAGAAGRATEAATAPKPSLVKQIVEGKEVAQAPAQTAMRSGAAASAADAGVAASTAEGAGVRTLMQKPIQAVADTERGLYDTVNKAAEVDMKNLFDHREDLLDALDDPTNVANRKALADELATTNDAIKVHSDLAASKGVSMDTLTQAKAATQQRYAMEALDQKLFNNESVVSGDVAHGAPESINVDAAIRQVQNLDKPSRYAPRGTPTRLVQALGQDGARALKQGLYDAQKAGQTALTKQKIALWVGGIGVGSGLVGGALKHALAAQ